MSVTSVEEDAESLTMTITAQFDAPTTRVWQLWQDTSQLERWWGPPTYPATAVGHDLTPGGSVTYFMTGPGGDTHHVWWRVSAVDAPRYLEFTDGFAKADGNPGGATRARPFSGLSKASRRDPCRCVAGLRSSAMRTSEICFIR